MRATTIALIGSFACGASAAGVHWWQTPSFRAVARVTGASALTANFKNFGQVEGPLEAFQPSSDPADPVRTFHWRDDAALERALRAVFVEAQSRQLDGTAAVDGRRGALDLVFASTHSATVVVPGPDGERVGAVISDRSTPSAARAGMLAAFARLAASDAGRYPRVRVHTVFLLNCGSVEDAGDHRALDGMVRALTGAPPTHLLVTAAKVNPDYRFVTAGHASGKPLTIYDVRPEAAVRPFLHIGRDGHWHVGTGAGIGLGVPQGGGGARPVVAIDPTTE